MITDRHRTPALDSAIRVLHVTPRLSRAGGGVTEAIWGLVRSTSHHRVNHSALAAADEWSSTDLQHAPEGCDTHVFPQIGPRSVFFSPTLGKYLQDSLQNYDIAHIHSIRHWPGLATRRIAAAKQRPLLISLHGMLYPEHLKKSPVRKAMLHTLFENATLRSAQCLHATSMQELDSIRQFGCRNPIAVIPLGIGAQADTGLSSAAECAALESRWPALRGQRRLLYLGMLDPKKGLLRLIAAWSRLQERFASWHLVIAGPGIGDYEAEVRREAARARLDDRVTFVGPQYGTDKALMLRQSELLVLPSDWENFGIVVGEALSMGVPVIASRTSPWQAIEQHDCGWWIEPTIDSLTQTLDVALAQSREQLSQRGARGKELIASRFSWAASGRAMAQVYSWLACHQSRPDCVIVG
jgi:glycosyltransferase involved in cell wall biosynthesis